MSVSLYQHFKAAGRRSAGKRSCPLMALLGEPPAACFLEPVA